MANYNLTQAVTLYNQDQVRTQTMYELKLHSGFSQIDNTLERMQVYGQGFPLPDRTVNFEELQYRAYKIPVPTTLDMAQDHNMTVYADVRGDLRRACLDWQAACINPDITDGSFFEANRRPSRLGPGANTEPWIQVDLLAPNYKNVVESVLIHGVRVTKVGGLEQSNTSGSISTFTVDFKSIWWEQLKGDQIGTWNEESNRNTLLGNSNNDGDYNVATEDTMSGGGGNRYNGSGGFGGDFSSGNGQGGSTRVNDQ